MASAFWKSLQPRVPALVAEALVVFLGVYAAFWLDGIRQQTADERRRAQILETIEQDCREASSSLESYSDWFEKTLGGPFLDAYAAGEQPPLVPIPLPTAQGTQSWQSMLAAGGLDVLEVDVIRQVDRLIASANVHHAQSESYNDYVRAVLVPSLDKAPGEHYEPESGRLRQKYLWYFYSLQAVRASLSSLSKAISGCESLAG